MGLLKHFNQVSSNLPDKNSNYEFLGKEVLSSLTIEIKKQSSNAVHINTY